MKRVKNLVHCQYNQKNQLLGKGVTVAVMDTGMMLHPQLQTNALFFRDFVNGRQEFYDDNGHGTHVCGIIGSTQIGMAPQCKLIALKVLDENGGGDIVCSMKGFRWILENQEKYNIRIVNISMGMKPNTNMEGEISGFTAYIDPNQDLISTNVLKVQAKVVPTALLKEINVDLSFDNPFNKTSE